MEHKGTEFLETERLILRRFRIEDSAAAFENWTKDDRVTEFLTWPAHPDAETTKKILGQWSDSYSEKNFYQWAIVLKDGTDQPIGSISIVEINEDLNLVQVGYCIGYKWWNKGIMTEAFTGIIPFLFEQVKVNRIEARHDPNNPGSGKVMAKCGLTFEGILRKRDRNNRGIVDVAIYSMLAFEYRSQFRK